MFQTINVLAVLVDQIDKRKNMKVKAKNVIRSRMQVDFLRCLLLCKQTD